MLLDVHGRPLQSLRLSVTDRCNLRCAYCMPEDEYAWLAREALLDADELARVVGAFARLGVRRLRITGGEPLLRPDLPALVARLRAAAPLEEVALTTNGVLLAEHAGALADAGIDRFTVSLDTLRPERFRALARRDALAQVLAGIDAARATGRPDLKLDCVVVRGVNDDELLALLDHARTLGAELRFIEYMDVGGATRWSREAVVSRGELLAAIEAARGPARAEPRDAAPAERFTLPDGQRFGVVASVTAPFCGRCDRARLTADGTFLTCLYATSGLELRGLVRAGADVDALAAHVADAWRARRDRGAEDRLAVGPARGALVELKALRRDPRLEMHTRGG